VVILTVARTIAAFGSALDSVGAGPRPWAIGFHDQEPIVFLTNPTLTLKRRCVPPDACGGARSSRPVIGSAGGRSAVSN